MYRIIGADTGKVYAQGTKAHCFRCVNNKYPYSIDISTRQERKIKFINQLYDEPLRIVKVAERR